MRLILHRIGILCYEFGRVRLACSASHEITVHVLPEQYFSLTIISRNSIFQSCQTGPLSSSPLLFHMLICGQQPCVCGRCSLSVMTCLLVSFLSGYLDLQSKKKMNDCMTLMICFMGDCFLSVVIECYLFNID